MSGVEGLIAVGIASNVVQFVDFGLKLCSRIREYSAAAGAPSKLATQADCVSDLLEVLKGLSETQQGTLEQRLISRCASSAQELSALLDSFTIKDRAKPPMWRNTANAWRSLRTEKRVLEFQKSLDNLLRPLNLNLQAKILQGAVTLGSGLNEGATAEPITIIPIARNPNFVGREDILHGLDQELAATQHYQSKAALCGLGGVGKSQIALEYAYRWLERSPERSVFWIHAGNTTRFEEAYKRIALEFDIPGRRDPNEDLMQIVRNWLESKYKCAWLMVVDNVDDANAFFNRNSFGKSPSEYLPQCPRGTVVYTTRDRRAGVNLTPGREPISVQSMSPVEARMLLGENVRGKSTEEEREELLEALNYLPLAISQAVAFMTERRQTVPQYLSRYRQSFSARMDLLRHRFTDHGRETRPMESVAMTFIISFDYIQKENPRASALLSIMSFLDGQGIPKSLIVDENEDQLDFDDAIGALYAFSLIEMNDQLDVYKVHRLVQLATRAWLAEYGEGGGAPWVSQALQLLSVRFPNGRYESWTTCAIYLPHAEALLRGVDLGNCSSELEEGARATILLNTSRYYYTSQGKFNAVESRLRESLRLHEKVLGKEHVSTLASVSELAWVLDSQGKYEEAEQMNRLALEGREKVLGKQHPDTLINIGYLALVLQSQGKYEEAERMNRLALEGMEDAYGKEHRKTIVCISNLASVLVIRGKYEEAEQMTRLALEESEKTLGKEHPHTATALNDLAAVLQGQGKYEEAEQMMRVVLEKSEKALGKEHPHTVTALSNLAEALQGQGKYEEAEQMTRVVLEKSEKALGKEHPNTLITLRNLAVILQSQGKYEEAERMSRLALKGMEQILGKEHPDTLTCLRNLTPVLANQSKYAEAEQTGRLALARMEKVLGPEHPNTLVGVQHLAYLFDLQNRWGEANPLYQRVYNGFEKGLGPNHPWTRATRDRYSRCLEKSGSRL